MSQSIKERIISVFRKEEPSTIRVWAFRMQDASYGLALEGSSLDPLYKDMQKDENAVLVDVPREAVDEEGNLVGGHIETCPWGEYPMTARWVPQEKTPSEE